MKLPRTIEVLAHRVKSLGGAAFLVGGGSIDILQQNEPKDWDIEVFGLEWEELIKAAEEFGTADLIGNKFGILKLKTLDGLDIELGIPRRDSKIGVGHKGFFVTTDKGMCIVNAARRRDFTINAIYIDLISGEVIDPYHGVLDLCHGLVRHVDNNTFMDDPLRVFRAFQIVARKGQAITSGTIDLIRDNIECLKELSGDAIFGELSKLLMLSKTPSVGLRPMLNIIELFPELKALVGCKQKEKYHPEGDTWTHTMMVVDEAAKWRHEIPEEWRLAFMFGMLLHDVGKPLALDSETLKTIDHDRMGEAPARSFMLRLTNNEDLINKVCSIVKAHMRPRLMLKSSPNKGSWQRLQNICPLNIAAYVSMCDGDGRGCEGLPLGKSDPVFIKVMDVFNGLGKPKGKIKPILQGRHLIETGMQPGPSFGAILKRAYEHQINTGCENIQELLNVASK